MAGSLAIIGGCLAYATPENKGPSYAATVFIFVYDTFFALGWLGVTWVSTQLRWWRWREVANRNVSCIRLKLHRFAFVLRLRASALRPTGYVPNP